jgi:small conductance mechanosensitive channel
LLANFAAGAFMIILRPIKAGDFVTADRVTGTVKEIGLFVTAINTLDKVLAIVGNGKIFADIIQNYFTNPYRFVDLKAQLNHSVNHNRAIQLLKERLAKIPNVKTEPRLTSRSWSLIWRVRY